ncbi:MAG: cytochrome P450 [Actinomycetota bacterium]|uniref:Cytochrome P450 n=1 Tax=marine metagenome TaxID=408172 RepID=A0A381PD05_9ZZZZ|nr:cytochrome P450 [Actinomycetota bacterium]MEE3187363.1 cytochrome P450 [Actinomycetota bacterium]
MPTPISEVDIPVISTEQPASESERRESLRQLTEGHWIARADLGYVIATHDDCAAMLRDRRWFSALSLIAETQNYENPEWSKRDRKSILSTEGDDHQRIRRIVSSAFTPKSADRLRPFMRDVVNELLDPVCERGESEFVADVCEPYPIPIICELLGAPREDWELFSRLAVDIFRVFNGNLAKDGPKIIAAGEEMDAYMLNLISERRSQPRDDLLSDLIAAEEEGDRLSTDELLSMANALLLAGTDTTRNQLGCAVALFAQHPEQFELLRDDPELAPGAVEEVMRYLGAVRGTARYASEDITYKDVLFPKGTLIFPNFVAANHDSEKFANPTEFDITREPGIPHLTFGSGAHFCLGAFLARAELQEAFMVVARRLPGLTLNGEISWKPMQNGIWGPESLPIAFLEGH